MDLPEIGAHCSLISCNTLDFLPITCQCNRSFCSQHITPELHGCTTLTGEANNQSTFADKIQRCVVDGCNKPSLQNFNVDIRETCSACHGSFCADHRHPETHACPSAAEQPLLKNATKGGSSSIKYTVPILPQRKPPTDPAKFAQWRKVELMKMQHRALPGDPKDKTASLPPDQRLHVKILHEDGEKVYWFRKAIITGKALDFLVTQLGMPDHNNTPWQLCAISRDGVNLVPLRNDRLLVDQVEDGGMLALRSKANV